MSFPADKPLKILCIRMSSMGDLVHTLPAIHDIHSHFPHAQIDWVAEEAFTVIAELSPLVHRIIPIALRRWRKTWRAPAVRAERKAFLAQLQAENYDVILDLQGLLKSAVVARYAHGPIYGLNWRSAKEPLASLLYHHRINVPWTHLMVERYRMIAAHALGYPLTEPLRFGELRVPAIEQPFTTNFIPSGPYVTIMPSSSADKKLWDPQHWRTVLRAITAEGLQAYLFSGSAQELARAQELTADIPETFAVPPIPLLQVFSYIESARAMVGLDSGLTHVAAALKVPTIGLYWPTAPHFAPICGESFTASFGGNGRHAEVTEVLEALQHIFSHSQERT